jgi:hypothetical protein
VRTLFEILATVCLTVMALCTAYQLGLWAIIPILLYPVGVALSISNPKYREELIKTSDELNKTLKELKEIF